jgi:hypothetical protein
VEVEVEVEIEDFVNETELGDAAEDGVETEAGVEAIVELAEEVDV